MIWHKSAHKARQHAAEAMRQWQPAHVAHPCWQVMLASFVIVVYGRAEGKGDLCILQHDVGVTHTEPDTYLGRG